MTEKKYSRRMTESGDWYSATPELWAKYDAAWEAVDMDTVMFLEEGNDPDFFYDPD